MLQMTDEAGIDAKILAVPIQALTPFYKNVVTHDDITEVKLAKIVHFFEHYKDLEEGKWVKVAGWKGPDAAKQEILASIARYDDAEVKPRF
jgi:inorganic pyrophosphatase